MRTDHDDLFFRIALPKVQIHQQFYLRKIYRTVVGNSGSEADEVIRTDDRVCLENRFFLPHPFYFLIIIGNLALGYNAVRALHFDKAFPVYNPDRVFVVAIALENIKLVRLFLQADIRNLRSEILLRELLRFRIIAFLQKIRSLYLRGAGGNRGDLSGLGVDFNMYFNCIASVASFFRSRISSCVGFGMTRSTTSRTIDSATPMEKMTSAFSGMLYGRSIFFAQYGTREAAPADSTARLRKRFIVRRGCRGLRRSSRKSPGAFPVCGKYRQNLYNASL